MYVFEDILKTTADLSTRINKLYKVNPLIKLIFCKECAGVRGSCHITSQLSDMYIELEIPYDLQPNKIDNIMIVLTILHEYSHYITAYNQTSKNRKISISRYLENNQVMCVDERDTWTNVKKLAQKLNFWDRELFKIMKSHFNHTSNLIYK